MTSDAPFTPADIEELLIEARRRRPGTMKQIALLLEANALVGLAHMQWTTPPAAVATSHPAALQPPITQVLWCGLRDDHEHHRHANRPDVQCPGAATFAAQRPPADTSWITTGEHDERLTGTRYCANRDAHAPHDTGEGLPRYHCPGVLAPASRPLNTMQLNDLLIDTLSEFSDAGGFTPSRALARRQLIGTLLVLRDAANRDGFQPTARWLTSIAEAMTTDNR